MVIPLVNMKKRILILLLFLFSVSYSQTARFVSKSGTSIAPYLSWEAACDSIRPVIEIADDGDTIYIGAGEYIDTLDIYKNLTIIGNGIDETMIHSDRKRNETINLYADLSISNLSIASNEDFPSNNLSKGITLFTNNALRINNCLFKIISDGILKKNGKIIVENSFFMITLGDGITFIDNNPAIWDTIKGCVFYTEGDYGISALKILGNNVYFENNIVLNGFRYGIKSDLSLSIVLKNNIISAANIGASIIFNEESVKIINNIFHNGINSLSSGIYISSSGSSEVTNNVIAKFNRPIILRNQSEYNIDYNCFYSNNELLNDTMQVGQHNSFENPMFLKFPDGSIQPEVSELELQLFSPCIDSGDPAIKDVDGSRSDMGALGGPCGYEYSYQDLPPSVPTDLESELTNDSLTTITWSGNDESDFAGYNLYIGDDENFNADDGHLYSSIGTNHFEINSEIVNQKYIKVRAYDLNGNSSKASEALYTTVTRMGHINPSTFTNKLLPAFPNPFNPETKIRFSLNAESHATLKVFDIRGELVHKEQEKLYPAGGHEVSLNLSNFASGIYIVTLQVEQGGKPIFIDSKKITLLK
ncbi:MAG: hypothetical protein SCALA702_01370 [Melioribacteraceae bacterium]|nr:MAG: hypothetical protein SCALA702_01370 [Melioribacteraceae bacterium]